MWDFHSADWKDSLTLWPPVKSRCSRSRAEQWRNLRQELGVRTFTLPHVTRSNQNTQRGPAEQQVGTQQLLWLFRIPDHFPTHVFKCACSVWSLMLPWSRAAHKVYTSIQHPTNLGEMMAQDVLDLLSGFKSVSAVHELRLCSTHTQTKHGGFWLLHLLTLFFHSSNIVLGKKIYSRCKQRSLQVRQMMTSSTSSPEWSPCRVWASAASCISRCVCLAVRVFSSTQVDWECPPWCQCARLVPTSQCHIPDSDWESYQRTGRGCTAPHPSVSWLDWAVLTWGKDRVLRDIND